MLRKYSRSALQRVHDVSPVHCPHAGWHVLIDRYVLPNDDDDDDDDDGDDEEKDENDNEKHLRVSDS